MTAALAGTEPLAPPEHARLLSVSGRLGTPPANQFRALFGLPWSRRLARGALLVPQVRRREEEYAELPDAELRRVASRLRGRARGGESLDKLLPEAFGLACVSARRALGLRPFDVQIAGGSVMHGGALVELATGEGKTLTASMPAFLNALTGKGVHVTTVNDYLAKRDAEWIGPIYELLGMSVGVLQQQMSDADRIAAYKCDLTYGTASEFGFDFLRDRLKLRGGQGGTAPFWSAWAGDEHHTPADPRVQRDLNFAIVDEADSIFIDEARTPLIIANPTRQAEPEEQVVYHWADAVARSMDRETHFKLDLKKNKCELTDAGKQLTRYSNPPSGQHSHAMDKLFEHVERSLQAHHRMLLDQAYMINEERKIIIIDEYTGRPMPDRHWREGLHQAVEAKERVPITLASDHAAKITFQAYFRLYKKLSGMSGTVVQNFWELRRVYKLWVVAVPTNRPIKREQKPDRVFPTEDAKFEAVVEEVGRLQQAGRPVLIGTRSVEKSEKLSGMMHEAGIKHQVLNARQNATEAEVVADAGQPGRVTIATNMAGRGTDIKLGPGVAAAGGLAVVGTERHDALRIDRQLIGRAGRQGDPGSGQFFLALDDELLEALGSGRQDRLKQTGRAADGPGGDWSSYLPLFHTGQRRMESRHYRQRLDLMYHEKQRKEMMEDLGADPFVD